MDALLASWSHQLILVILEAFQDTPVIPSDTIEAVLFITADFFNVSLWGKQRGFK